jgi:hypothetical protein
MKTIGAKHGLGRLRFGPVATFVVAGLPSTMLRQPTIARNEEMRGVRVYPPM